ncbi:MAG TPA: response regulator [Candidatus Paceibacterota bacterium]|nr:response regulator [Candidatus Paceibacterota bacterium]
MAAKEKTVLVVEDDKILQTMLRNALEASGITTLTANNGEDAITLLEETAPDLVLLDIDMPKLGGIEVLKQLRAAGRHDRVVMLTNLSTSETIADAAELGVSEYLVKADWDIDEIVAKVETKIGKGKST